MAPQKTGSFDPVGALVAIGACVTVGWVISPVAGVMGLASCVAWQFDRSYSARRAGPVHFNRRARRRLRRIARENIAVTRKRWERAGLVLNAVLGVMLLTVIGNAWSGSGTALYLFAAQAVALVVWGGVGVVRRLDGLRQHVAPCLMGAAGLVVQMGVLIAWLGPRVIE